MRNKILLLSIILIIISSFFIYFACDDFNLRTGAMGDPPLSEIQKIIAIDAENDDFFGAAVSISGDYAISSTYNEDGAGIDIGAAYIYHRTGTNTWDTGVKITAQDAEDNVFFGASSSISGDYAIVGAMGKNGAGNFRGAAYIYHNTDTNTWDTGVKITAQDTEDFDMFGSAVSISGDYAIVGAMGKSGAGAAYIYYRTDTNTWDTGVKITASDAEDGDNFGLSVSISGDYAIVGAYGEDEGGIDSGSAYIYHRTDINTWDTGVKITASDAEDDDNFGLSVSISGDYAIVGARKEDGEGINRGAAYIYHRTNTNTWDTGVKITAPDAENEDWFGFSVSLYGFYEVGDFAIIGAPYEDGEGFDRGAAYIFYRTGINTWVSGDKITASDAEDEDWYGLSVSTSGEYAIIGAYSEDGEGIDRGAAYILE